MEPINCYKIMTVGEQFKEGDEVFIMKKKDLNDLNNSFCGKGERFREHMFFIVGEAKCVVIDKVDAAELMKKHF